VARAPAKEGRLVAVAVALPVEGDFTYREPAGLELVVGHAVLVPFGRRSVSGYVIAVDIPHPGGAFAIREVLRLHDPIPAFTPDELPFLEWAARYYLVGLGEVIATALPTPFRGTSRRVWLPTEAGIEAVAAGDADGLDEDRRAVLREVISRPGRTSTGLARVLSAEMDDTQVKRQLNLLQSDGLIAPEDVAPAGVGGQVKTVRWRGASAPTDLGARMRGVAARLLDAGGSLDLSQLLELEGDGARDAVKRLERKGLVEVEEREDRSIAIDSDLGGRRTPLPLNPQQQAAVAAILTSGAGPILLHGVTGSGKTEVYLQAAAAVLAGDPPRQVLILVPEIALTPLLTGRFRARFGDAVAVLHSGLGAGERLREWRRIRAGDARVAIGARSALFAPLPNLGLIVVDEEHDDSYKQDEGVRYHARDLAVVRAHFAGCPVVLGSATPSMESWANCKAGRYQLVELPERATQGVPPDIEVVDICGLPATTAIAPVLVEALQTCLAGGGKAIVLYNRRGYAPVVECPGCGGHYDCPSCGVGLVYHQRRGRLTCHYCGFHRTFQPDCPTCGTQFAVLGHGTERVAEVLEELFPGIGIGRMDADTTVAKGSHQRILDDFAAGRTRLLVGTQLVAKGHDFPDVHLALVVGVDQLLMLPDFRSAERTFSLVTQLAGRAGRGDRPGRVLVQTRHAGHFVFRQLEAGGGDIFRTEEARLRRVLGYPPSTRLALVRVEGADRATTHRVADELADALRRSARSLPPARPPLVDVLGPTPAPMGRLVGRWRFQVVLRGREPAPFRRWLDSERALLRGAGRERVRVQVDVDPRNLM
jgi:primosomal protein N' (replication factor Y) (superfamily II helicase)